MERDPRDAARVVRAARPAPGTFSPPAETMATARDVDDPTGAPTVLRPPRRRLAEDEAAAFDAAPAEQFRLEDLPPAEQEGAREIASAAQALILKGLLHRADPRAFPVPDEDDAPETVVARLAAELHPRAFARVAPALERVARERPRLQRMLAPRHAQLDLRQARLDVAPRVRVRPRPTAGDRTLLRTRGRDDTPRDAATTYRRAHLVLRALHCVRLTTPRDSNDDMVLATVLIGASGNVAAGNALVCGEFTTGERADFGELYLGDYSLRSTQGYPKHLYAIFKLVESDSDDAEVARELASTISFLAQTVLSAVFTPAVGMAAGAVLQTVGSFVSNLIDEDELRPMGIRLTLEKPDPFGGPVSKRMVTPDITGHGAIYRIGYRWVLGA